MTRLADIITKVEKQKTKEAQIKVLKENNSPQLKTVLGYAMNPNVQWLIPDTDPPYTPLNADADQEGALYGECRKFEYFVRSPEGMKLTQSKREQLFIQLLEGIDPRDAKLVLRIKDKALTIMPEAVKEAFPNLTKDW